MCHKQQGVSELFQEQNVFGIYLECDLCLCFQKGICCVCSHTLKGFDRVVST